MKPAVRKFFCCPKCRSDLSFREKPGSSEGVLESISCGSCGYTAPVRDGIPRFVPLDNYASTFG